MTKTEINGRVTELTDEAAPVAYATIRLTEADSTMAGGTTTDGEGRFRLAVRNGGGGVLTVSCVGYDTVSVTVGEALAAGRDTLQIHLRPTATMLGGITVDGNAVIAKADRKVLLPNREQLRTATDGMDLLRKMQPARLSVNQMSGEVTMAGGGKVLLCIDGVQVTGAELAAIRPEDIIRIEYHDDPGARYAGAGAVVDYITRRRETGGGVSGDSFTALGSGKRASIDHLSAQYNSGRSAWSLVAGYFGQRRDNWVRDYDETWRYPDREVRRHEEGLPVRIGGDGLEAHLNYSVADEGRYFFNARMSMDYNYVPAKEEEGDRRARLYTSDMAALTDIYEHTTERSTSPSLDLYLSHQLGGGRQIILDVVGTYIHTGSSRTYRESQAGSLLSESSADVSGDKWSLIAEAIYEQKAGNLTMNGGLRHLQAYTANSYGGTVAADVALRQAETSAFAECRYRSGAWGLTGSVTASRIRYGQADRSVERYALQPAARITFQPSERLFMRYGADLRTQSPSLSDMSDVTQEVQTGMVRRGNPELKPFRVLSQHVAAGYDCGWLGADLTVGYRHEYNPIMESVVFEQGLFVRTFDNQRAFSRLSAEATVTLRPWRKHLSVAITPLVYRYFSRGNTYSHTHTISRLKVDADLSYGPWLLSYNTMMGPANTMYGEEWMEEKNMNSVLVGYKLSRWTVQAGLFNAFMNEYVMETRNDNALAPFTSRAHCNKNTYFTMKLSFNLTYGRQAQRHEKKINNEDKETGIMRGTK